MPLTILPNLKGYRRAECDGSGISRDEIFQELGGGSDWGSSIYYSPTNGKKEKISKLKKLLLVGEDGTVKDDTEAIRKKYKIPLAKNFNFGECAGDDGRVFCLSTSSTRKFKHCIVLVPSQDAEAEGDDEDEEMEEAQPQQKEASRALKRARSAADIEPLDEGVRLIPPCECKGHPLCSVGEPSQHDKKNAGRKYFSCAQSRCSFYEWFDPTLAEVKAHVPHYKKCGYDYQAAFPQFKL